jgi:DNA-binding MarR family transcriptional regulator
MILRSLLLTLQNIITAAEDRSRLGQLSHEDRRLLAFVAGRFVRGQQTCLGDVIATDEHGSQKTITKRLRDLEADGWLRVERDPTNYRKRRIRLTTAANEGLEEASRMLERQIPLLIKELGIK